MLGNFASLVVTSFVSLSTLFSPTPKIISPIPQQHVTITATKPTIQPVKKLTSSSPMNVPSPLLTPSAIPSQAPAPTIAPTTIPSLTPTSTTIPTPTATVTLTPTPTPVASTDTETLFTTYASHYSIDREQLKKIADCESGRNPLAENGPYGGMYQFSENSWISTRTAMGMDTNVTLRFNAEEAIRTAAFKLSTGGKNAWPNCGN